MNIIVRLVSMGALISLLVGCGPVATPVITHYTLSTQPRIIKHARRTHKTMVVSMPLAAPGYGSTGIAYTQKPHQLSYYAMHRWVAPPVQLLLPDMVTAIQKTHRFAAVVAAPYGGHVDYQLDSRLLKLVENFKGGQPSMQLVMQVNLVNAARGRIVASKVFNLHQPVTEVSPAAAVDAANQAVAKMLLGIADFVTRYAK